MLTGGRSLYLILFMSQYVPSLPNIAVKRAYVVFILVLAALSNTWGAEPSSRAVAPGATLAHSLLALEFDSIVEDDSEAALDYLINAAVARFGSLHNAESERNEALRFFRSVDQALIEAGVIYPPRGEIDLLRNALKPRALPREDLASIVMSPYNTRRGSWIRANHSAGGKFYYFDCDVASVLYVAAAEKLGLPVVLVELPGHNFVRWISPGVRINWDPNEGSSVEDTTYAHRWRVTPQQHDLFGYLEPMSRQRIQAYWLLVVGQWKCRNADFAGGLRAFRSARELSPQDLPVMNELAWLLATAPDKTVRSGGEAVLLAEKLIDRARRPSWLDTLAAACAEVGDFKRAVALEEEGKAALEKNPGELSANENISSFDACLEIYRSGCSYAQAIAEGRIHPLTSRAKQND